MNKFYKLLLIAALICFGLSLVLPGIVFQPGSHFESQVMQGYDILTFNSISGIVTAITTQNAAVLILIPLNFFFGLWTVIFTFGAQAWFGNLLFLLALLSVKRKLNYQSALIFSSGAALVGLLALIFTSVHDGSGGGSMAYVDHLDIGYYVWEISFIILVVYCLLNFLQSRKAEM